MSINYPGVGKWYKELREGTVFEVVAVDEQAQTIETQLIDGEITEYDLDSWSELRLLSVEAPEDWRTGYELADEDSQMADDVIVPEDWSNPVQLIESDIVNGVFDDL